MRLASQHLPLKNNSLGQMTCLQLNFHGHVAGSALPSAINSLPASPSLPKLSLQLNRKESIPIHRANIDRNCLILDLTLKKI
jgi:hypothetical protein